MTDGTSDSPLPPFSSPNWVSHQCDGSWGDRSQTPPSPSPIFKHSTPKDGAIAQNDKHHIAANFGHAAHTYHTQAHLQQAGAKQLLTMLDDSLRRSATPLPNAPILEIGCGTGFITRLLVERAQCGWGQLESQSGLHRPLHITDLSPEMVQFCQSHIQSVRAAHPLGCQSRTIRDHVQDHVQQQTDLSFRVLDAETATAPPNTYSLIVGGFVAQWFQNLEDTVHRFLQQLQPGGRLLLSFPGHQSFPEWRHVCQCLDLPFTAHPLPNPITLLDRLQPQHYELKVNMWSTVYDSPAAFFRSMKAIGAGFSQSGVRLSPKQMRQLLKGWTSVMSESALLPNKSHPTHPSGPIEVHYQVVYLLITK